jgi:drug/metabolite transporter (DMT)-like permease
MTLRVGYVAVLASALLTGVGITLNKLALAEVNPTVVAGLTYLFAGVALAIARFSPLNCRLTRKLKGSVKTEAAFCRKDIVVLLLLTAAGSVVAPFLFLNGLNGTTAVNASLLQNAESLFTILIAVLFLKEKAKRKDWFAVLFLVVGAVFITTNAEFGKLTLTQTILGNVFIVVACLFWGIDNNLSKLLCFKEDLLLPIVAKCLLGGTVLLALAYTFGSSLAVPLAALPYLMFVGVLSTGFSIVLFWVSLREIGSMRTGAIFATSSLFGVAFAFAILGEGFTLIQVSAGLLMVLGVYVLYRK